MDKYFGKKNVTNVKECLKEGTVYGPLCAYRLFYVGCSQCEKKLSYYELIKKILMALKTNYVIN